MIVGLLLSGIYNKFLATKTYTARQSLILRDDLMGDAFKPSRFESQEQLKSAQETILEIARKPQVVKAVLEQLGPTSSFSLGGDYPSMETIEDVQGNIGLSAPNGAEFGKTEAVVLSVKTVGAERSRKFVNLLLDEIDSKLNEVRLLRLGSMKSELSQAGENALKSLNDSSSRLQELEKSFGAEITTIRGLNDPQGSGGFDLKVNQIRLEQRQAAAQLSSAKQQRELLQQAQRNGGVEFVTSNELLELQPALKGMMTNLSTAMAQLAIDEGRYTSLHPQLQRSRRAVKQQRQQLFGSIGTTIKGLDSQIETLTNLSTRLGDSIVQLETKLENLTEQRVPYATLEEEVKKKAEVYNDVQGQLAQVQSYASSTDEVAMLTRVDDPQVSSRPDQIGAAKAGMIGAALGLMLGLGLVALLAPPFVDPRTNYAFSAPGHSGGVAAGSHDPVDEPSSVQPKPRPSGTPQESHAESRLKSVTAMRRTPTDSLTSKLAEHEDTESGMGLAQAPVESAVPDAISQHMAAAKQRLKDGLPTQKFENAPSNEVEPSRRKVKPSADLGEIYGSDAAVAESAETNKAASSNNSEKRSDVSSESVIAELKELRGKASASKPSRPATVAEEKVSGKAGNPQAAVNDGVAVKRRPTVSSILASANNSPKTAEAAKPTPAVPADSAKKLEIGSVDRMRSPRVPESITKGRITAESLLMSAEKNKDSQDQKTQAGTSAKEKIAALASEPQQTSAPEGGIESTGGKSLDARIPSITDYARSLDRKLGTSEGDRIADSINNISNGIEASTPGQRASNVRPLDIAKTVGEASLLGVAAQNILPGENSVQSTSQTRSESLSDYVGAMDNSVAGLVRGAKGADVDQIAVRTSEEPVAPSEKTAAKPTAVPVPRDEVSSKSIPAQIQELSGSFSSFTRPTESQ